jgi:hypothetical protein
VEPSWACPVPPAPLSTSTDPLDPPEPPLPRSPSDRSGRQPRLMTASIRRAVARASRAERVSLHRVLFSSSDESRHVLVARSACSDGLSPSRSPCLVRTDLILGALRYAVRTRSIRAAAQHVGGT